MRIGMCRGRFNAAWMVFLASSSALVASAALATVLGTVLRSLFEGPWLKLGAGALFIVIGVLTIWSVLKPA